MSVVGGMDLVDLEPMYTPDDILQPSDNLLNNCPLTFIWATRKSVSALLQACHYGLAVRVLHLLLTAVENVYGEENEEYMRTIYQLAITRNKQGHHEEAARLLASLLVTSKLVLGPAHQITLKTSDALAETYRGLGKFNEAEALMKENIRLLLARNDTDAALVTRNNLGLLYVQQKRPARARRCLEITLAHSENLRKHDDPDMLCVIGNLAYVYRDLGMWQEAEAMYRRSMAISIRSWGCDHPETVGIMASFAASYAEMGRWDDARALAERVLDARQRRFGADHVETLKSQYNLGNIHLGNGSYPEALASGYILVTALDHRAPDGIEDSISPDLTALTKWDRFLWQHFHAVCLINNELYDEAEKLHSKLMRMFESEENNKEYSDCFSQSLYDIGRIRKHQLRFAEAESYFRQAFAVTEATEDVDSKAYSIRVEALITLLRGQKRCSEARKLLQTSLSRAESTHGPDSLATANWLLKLGNFFKDHCRWSEARDQFVRALHIREQVLGSDHVDNSVPSAALAQCLEHLGDDEQAVLFWSRALKSSEGDVGVKNGTRRAWIERLRTLSGRLGREAKDGLQVDSANGIGLGFDASDRAGDDDEAVTLAKGTCMQDRPLGELLTHPQL
ncbi:MAG: hypothetical protein L6R40_005417 [Gallowayella cf. fulva]|nr:MAG: hypothetical protein L6R40_005417 [Xanthomendoza cf. fulva]